MKNKMHNPVTYLGGLWAIFTLAAVMLTGIYLYSKMVTPLVATVVFLAGLGAISSYWFFRNFLFASTQTKSLCVQLHSVTYPMLEFFGGTDNDYALRFDTRLRDATIYGYEKERIIHSSIRHHSTGLIYSCANPGRHHHVIKIMAEMNRAGLKETQDQGFITNYGRYVDRKEAWDIAHSAKQLINRGEKYDQLFSEDAWDTPSREATLEKAFKDILGREYMPPEGKRRVAEALMDYVGSGKADYKEDKVDAAQ